MKSSNQILNSLVMSALVFLSAGCKTEQKQTPLSTSINLSSAVVLPPVDTSHQRLRADMVLVSDLLFFNEASPPGTLEGLITNQISRNALNFLANKYKPTSQNTFPTPIAIVGGIVARSQMEDYRAASQAIQSAGSLVNDKLGSSSYQYPMVVLPILGGLDSYYQYCRGYMKPEGQPANVGWNCENFANSSFFGFFRYFELDLLLNRTVFQFQTSLAAGVPTISDNQISATSPNYNAAWPQFTNLRFVYGEGGTENILFAKDNFTASGFDPVAAVKMKNLLVEFKDINLLIYSNGTYQAPRCYTMPGRETRPFWTVGVPPLAKAQTSNADTGYLQMIAGPKNYTFTRVDLDGSQTPVVENIRSSVTFQVDTTAGCTVWNPS